MSDKRLKAVTDKALYSIGALLALGLSLLWIYVVVLVVRLAWRSL